MKQIARTVCAGMLCAWGLSPAFAGGEAYSKLKAQIPADMAANAEAAVPSPERPGGKPESPFQQVRVVSKGPALLALIGGTVEEQKLVVGYKKGGDLGDRLYLTMQVDVVYYGRDGVLRTSRRMIDMIRFDSGFVTPAMAPKDYINLENLGFRGIVNVGLAFVSGNRWDSNDGNLYKFPYKRLAAVTPFISPEYSNSQEVTPPCWEYIAGEMRK